MVYEREVEKDCFTPRNYQVELLDKASKRNIIVQLGTGAGKTFIAVLLLKEYGLQLNTPYKDGGKRAFFIVNSVSLVEQQANHIECRTTLKVARIHGNLNSGFLEQQKYEEFRTMLNESQVFVMTAQIFLDTIQHGFFDLKRAAVLIFDECHHAIGNHPYRQIMEHYGELSSDCCPRILGLTASLINQKIPPHQLEAQLTKLENSLHSVIETASDLVALSKYGAKPREHIVLCKEFVLNNSEYKPLETLMKEARDFCRQTNEFDPLDFDPRKPILEAIVRTLGVLTKLGPWAAWKIANIWEKEVKKLTKEKYLPEKAVEFLIMGYTIMMTVRRKLESKMKPIRAITELSEYLPHKVVRLIEILSSYSPENQKSLTIDEPLCAIVFVKERYIAYALNIIFKQVSKIDPRLQFLQPDYVIGYSGTSFTSEESQSLHKRQDEVLRKFRKGELNILFSTTVLEEGVDVRHCNLVVRFDRPEEFRAYVQSKGRARKKGANYVILVDTSDSIKCNDDLRDFIQIEKHLIKRYKTVHNPIEMEFPDEWEDPIPPYEVEAADGAKATVSIRTAIALINRYCAKLPSDVFTRLVPQNRIIPVIEKGITKYKAELLLPINSPVKQPIRLETPVASKKLAQMCVALEGCKLLHQRGELNNHLLPVGRESIANLFDDDPDEFCPGMNAKVGSSRRKQLYDRRVAITLHNGIPIPNRDIYLYVFEMELIKEPSIEHNPKGRKFVRPEEYEHCFGFLSSVILPKVPSFPAYLRQGDMRVHIKRSPTPITFNNQKLTLIKYFHNYIFDKVLQLYKGNLEFKMGEHTPINTLIVPLNREMVDGSVSYSVNMKYVEDVVINNQEMPRRPNEEDRKNYKFKAEDYRDAVVMPWYRNTDQPVFFYVAEILDDMNPSSQFPDKEYSSFNEYFIKKYNNLEIYDQEQALLDVDFTSNRLNLLLPRPGGIKKKPRAENSQQQIFVPELMDKHPISATLWNLIAALPSCFYRMNHLILADELRIEIASALNIDPRVPEEFDWTPLSYPATYEEKQSLIVNKIQQLREMNKIKEPERENLKDREKCSGEFEIGVWDPSAGEDVIVGSNQPMEKQGEPEAVGLMSTAIGGGDLSDEEDAVADQVIFDFAGVLKKEQHNKFGAPRENIEAQGWGDVEENVDDNTPFQILNSGSSQIDTRSLMADVGKVVLGAGEVSTTTVVPELIAKSPQKLEYSSKELDAFSKFEDREKSRDRDETIDLSQFDDKEKTEPIWIKTSGSDDEAEDLDRGEERKHKEDAKFVEKCSFSAGGVLAPELKETFSFASASTYATSFIKKCAPTSSGNDLMNLNPYGVSPCDILTALTTSNATDGINLERLETIGDSFLKYAVTDFLYHSHPDQHEGKLSFARSKEVSNCNLYRLGKKLGLPSLIVASKFEVQDSWLPPCSVPPDFKAPNADDAEEKDLYMESVLDGNIAVDKVVKPATGWDEADRNDENRKVADGVETIEFSKQPPHSTFAEEIPPLPHNHLTQQYISDKSIADAVEALIGAHLMSLGPRPTLKVMKWMGLKVLTNEGIKAEAPLLRFVDSPDNPEESKTQLKEMYIAFNFANIEEKIGYSFNDKAYLLQAFTHASYYKNRITGCYQRLEFLGDAVLDYMITRFLYEDGRQYSPGVLTDLRSALVNNTIFASLAVKYQFHKHFIEMCPGLHHMIGKFVQLCQERSFFDANFNAEMYMVTTEEEIDEGQEEDIEVPKALSDVFESVAGAIYLDSGRDLDVVWRIFHNLMKQTIDECCANPPRSPIRELMELEPGRTRFSKMERIIETGKVRVTVDIGGKLKFTGMGRNYRIAKTTAAKRALRYLKSLEEQKLRERLAAAKISQK